MLFQADGMAQSRQMCINLHCQGTFAHAAAQHRRVAAVIQRAMPHCRIDAARASFEAASRLLRGAAAVLLAASLALPGGAVAKTWGCHGTKPGHPTPAERAAFIREVS